jgi:two-component system OmpR family response regulator
MVVDDEVELADAIGRGLRREGYAVDVAYDGTDALAKARVNAYDLICLDLTLPDVDGVEICRRLRDDPDATPTTPRVLMLTARDSLDDRITGLDAGADDYLVKPFAMAELAARIRALARRRGQLALEVEEIGDLRFERTTRRLTGPDGLIDLPRRELALFELLLECAGRVVPKDRIGEALYGTGSEIEPNAIELLVSRLRRKLGGSGVEIRTARGLGYMLDGGP